MIKASNFKGHPVMIFEAESKYPVTLGVRKIKAVLENLEAVRWFLERVDEGDKFEEEEDIEITESP